MNSLHSSIISLFNMFSNWFIQVSLSNLNMVIDLLIDLVLSLRSSLSAFLIIYLAFGVLMVLFNLTLVGITSLFRHLREKHLTFSSDQKKP